MCAVRKVCILPSVSQLLHIFTRMKWLIESYRLGLTCQYEKAEGPLSTSGINLFPNASLDADAVQRFYDNFQRDRETVRITIDTYFETVHKWFPIINEARYKQGLHAIPFAHNSDDLLLLLSMHLITQRPDSKPSMNDWLYRAVKQLCHAIIAQSPEPARLKVLQSNVLLATYEYGHDMIDAASLTNGICVSMAYTLGLNTLGILKQGDEETHWEPYEEERRVWWAVVINDRFVEICTIDVIGS